VFGRQPLMTTPQRHRLRRLQKPLRAIGVFLEFHNPNLVSVEWPTPVPPSARPATELSMMANKWAGQLIRATGIAASLRTSLPIRKIAEGGAWVPPISDHRKSKKGA
jgi:hypothetical protein